MHWLGSFWKDTDRPKCLLCAASTQVSERELDLVLDRVYDLNPDTPVIKTNGRNGVDPELVFGLDTALFSTLQEVPALAPNFLWTGSTQACISCCPLPMAFSSLAQANKGVKASTSLFHSGDHYDSELDTLSVIAPTLPNLPLDEVVAKLADLPKSSVFRIKGLRALLGGLPKELLYRTLISHRHPLLRPPSRRAGHGGDGRHAAAVVG